MLILETRLGTLSLSLQEVLQQCSLLLIFVARHAELLHSRFVSGPRSLKQQRGFLPFAVFCANFDSDLRFCLLNTVACLFDSLACLENLVVAASPVERLLGQEKAGRGNILRKNLHVVDSLIAHLKTQVRNVFGFCEAPVVFRLFFFQVRLASLGAVRQSFLPG